MPWLPPPHRMLALVPAFNEELNLARVVRELRRVAPDLDILVVNDGSTDGTIDLLPTLGIDWLTLPQRVGVGGAVRAGLRYAVRQGYDYVVRIDGDGQHRASDVVRMLAPVVRGRLDASIGSRFVPTMRPRPGRRLTLRRLSQAALAGCLTVWTRQRFTDPTSGFWLFGPRAVRLLGRHHPTGYAEPELVLFLCRNGLRVGEVPIRMRPRRAGPHLDHAGARHAGIRAHDPGADDGPPVTKAGVMTDLVQIIAVSVSSALLALVLELVRRRKLTEEYSVLWVLCGAALLVFSIWRDGLHLAARALGIYYPPAVLILGARLLRVRRLALVLGCRLASATADRADDRGSRADRPRPARATQPCRVHNVRAGGARFRGPPPRGRTAAARRVTSARTRYSEPQSIRL